MFNISITNFKNVIETKTYTFEPNTIIHLVGPSGAGKSTILWAIEWGLFGRLGGVKHRSRRDLIPHVSIETDKIHIDRNGSDLTVTIKALGDKPPITLTSDAAQGHIYKEFGDKDLWKSCSYLEQRCRNLLLEGSGEDKLRILRELVYGYGIGQENDPEYYLIKIQEKLKKTLSDKKTYQAIYDSFYHEMEKEIEKYSKINNRWEDYENNTEGASGGASGASGASDPGGGIIFLKEKIGILTSDFKSLSKYHNDQLHVKKSIIDLEKRLSKIKKEEDFTDDSYNEKRKNILISIDHLTSSLQDQELNLKIKEFIPFKINANLLQDLKIKQSNRKRILADLTSLGFKVSSKKDCDRVKRKIELYEELCDLKEKNDLINKNIEKINENIKQENKNIDKYKETIKNENKNIEKLNENIKYENKNIDKINENINHENKNIDKNKENIKNLLEKINQRNENINDNKKKITENIEKIDQNKKKIEHSIEKINEFVKDLGIELDPVLKLTPVKNELICSQGSLKKSIQGFNNRIALKCPCCKESVYLSGKGTLDIYEDINIADIKNQLNSIEYKLDIINKIENEESKIKDIELKIKELKLKNKDLEIKIKEFISNIEEIELNIKSFYSNIDDITLKIKDLYSNIDEIKLKIKSVYSNIEEIKLKIKSLYSNIEEIELRIKDLIIEEATPDKDRYKELLEMNIPIIKNKDNLLSLIEKYSEIEGDSHDEDSQITELENGESLSKLLGQKLKDYLNDPDSFKVTTDCNIKDKIKELKEYLRELENKKSMWMKACSEKEFLEKELEDFKKKIDENHDEKELKKMESSLENLRSLEIDWIRYEEMRQKIDKLDEYESDLRKVNSDVEILETLYEKIKKLSIEPVEKIIEVINYKLNEHLDKLFTETPIKVLLSLFRQSSGSSRDSTVASGSFLKISVNIQVYHGENNYPNISSLSGGEADRVSLALTLTLAEIFGSPIILLDECMASLDADLRESCLEIIKDMSVTVIDVCHESVEGYHDMIISVVD